MHQLGDVFAALAQRRQRDHDDTQAVEKIFAELLFLHRRFQVAMRGGDDAHVHRDRFLAAQALEASFLQHAQQFHLRARGQVADFIEEDRAAVGLLEAADAARVRAGERAAFVAEEFALQQRLGDGGAVDGDERLLRAVAVLVDGARDQFLAGAGFAADEHGDRLGGDAANLLVDRLHGAAVADDSVARRRGAAHFHRLGHQPAAGERPWRSSRAVPAYRTA